MFHNERVSSMASPSGEGRSQEHAEVNGSGLGKALDYTSELHFRLNGNKEPARDVGGEKVEEKAEQLAVCREVSSDLFLQVRDLFKRLRKKINENK